MSWRPTIGSWNEAGVRSYRVILSQTGPRGGKRPPILDADVYGKDQGHAIERAKRYLNRRLRVEAI